MIAAVASVIAGAALGIIGVLGLRSAWQSRDGLEFVAAIVLMAVAGASVMAVFA